MKVLVVGGGSIGARHLSNLNALSANALSANALGTHSLAVAECQAERLKMLCEQTGAVGFREFQNGLSWQPDIVVIATPTQCHLAQALEAARCGAHLFIEKPLSHVLGGIADLCREVEQRKLVTMVACNMRFHPGPARVKALLEAGTIGSVLAGRIQTGSYLPRWRPKQNYHDSYSASTEHGGAILDCIHELDLALWYFGPARLAGAVRRPAKTIGLNTDGLAELLLEHESGPVCSVHLNFIQRDYRRSCQIIGQEGTIYWDFGARRVCVYGTDGELQESFSEPEAWQINRMYQDELEHFLQAVQAGVPSVNPVSGGLAALQLALAAKQQAARGDA